MSHSYLNQFDAAMQALAEGNFSTYDQKITPTTYRQKPVQKAHDLGVFLSSFSQLKEGLQFFMQPYIIMIAAVYEYAPVVQWI